MENKNILIVCPYFYPEGGGLELYAFKTAEYLSKSNNVIVVCATKEKSKIEDIGFKIIRKKPAFFVSNTPINFNLRKDIELIIIAQNINLIIAHSPVPYYADIAAGVAKKHNIPFVLHYHSSSLYKGNLIIDAIAFLYENLFEKKLFNSSKKIISASYYPIDKKLAKYKEKTSVIAPFIDLKKFKPSQSLKKEILFVGQLDKSHRWKGLDNLLEAFSIFQGKNPDYKLIVAGDGNYKKHYQKKSEKLGVKEKIIFAGKMSQNEMIDLYQNCYFVVVPSISDVEGTPTVLFEAMASGKPVIGGNAGGIPYIIKKENCGIIADARNIKELAEKIGYLANDKMAYGIFSKNCLKNIEEYGQEKSLKKIEFILDN